MGLAWAPWNMVSSRSAHTRHETFARRAHIMASSLPFAHGLSSRWRATLGGVGCATLEDNGCATVVCLSRSPPEVCLPAGFKGWPPKRLRVRTTSEALFAVCEPAADLSAAHLAAGEWLRDGANTGACVWSMVFGGCCAVCGARPLITRDDTMRCETPPFVFQ